MKKYIKFVLHEFSHDSRNMREMDAIKNLYDDVIVISTRFSKSFKNNTKYKVVFFDYFLHKLSIVRKIQVFIYLFITIPFLLNRQKAHTISANDLLALCIAWYANLFRFKKAKLVYDSHDLEIGKDYPNKYKNILLFWIKRVEKFLMKRVAFSIFCVDSVATYIQELYNLKEKPLVVRNIPYKWTLNENQCFSNKKKFLTKFNLPENSFICLYHGIIGYGRGIETLIKMIKDVDGAVLFLLGMGDDTYLSKINQLIDKQTPNKVFIIPAVEPSLLKEYICIADIGIMVIPALMKNNYYMLPNKFFENIQSENPVICSNFPEISKIVNTFEIGLTVDPENIKEIQDAVTRLKTDRNLYTRLKNNTKKAKEELCWENEKEIILKRYKVMLKLTNEKVH
jgi:glycosyltransferase involved in cell wall biosynthesis